MMFLNKICKELIVLMIKLEGAIECTLLVIGVIIFLKILLIYVVNCNFFFN